MHGRQAGGINGRTRVRMINYAIYQDRGTAIAKRLRTLWNGGCNVADHLLGHQPPGALDPAVAGPVAARSR